ncbi:ABC transporter substrate-binding protein [Salarchaeum japonicum]|uniref:Cobalamin-binding protein n=1 Tax=Salarchaeum japonicum TaxID=555573 RepID=A0AAV3SYN9_9EURY|nr:ABC transporter substrate-binding protein [Salarchaeum japonicum]
MSDPVVVSLLPSATEILYALACEPAAVSHECDYPPDAAEKPAANRLLIDPDVSSEEINDQLEGASDVYEIRRDVLEAIDPDVVVTQGVCDVCAVDEVLVADAVSDLGLDCEVVTTDPHHLDDVFGDIERIGAAVGRDERAAELVERLRARVRAVAERVPDGERPRTLVCDWMSPPMIAGHWVPELVETAGGEYGLAAPGAYSEYEDWADVVAFDPEVFVAAPCGFGMEQTLDNLDELREREGWRDLAAVESGRVFAVDGHHYVNRPGPRLVDTLELLAWCLHPEAFETPEKADARRVARRVA